jgi:hypothetical protein
MARPRNNITKQPWSIREIACRAMFDGATNADIDKAVATACREHGIEYLKVHGTTILAYRKSDEYSRYADRRRQWNAEQAESRSLWAAISADGSAESAVQAARYLGLRDVVRQLQSGDLSPTDTSRLATALGRMQADILEDARAEWQAERTAIEIEHEHELVARQGIIDTKDATIAQLRAELAGGDKAKGLTPETIADLERRMKLL